MYEDGIARPVALESAVGHRGTVDGGSRQVGVSEVVIRDGVGRVDGQCGAI